MNTIEHINPLLKAFLSLFLRHDYDTGIMIVEMATT
jgi:hypothetical protein